MSTVTRLVPNPVVLRFLRRYGERLGRTPLPTALGLPGDAVVAVPADGERVFRVIGRSTPRRRDFESNREKERPRAPDEPFIDYPGVSVFASAELAAGKGFSIARTYEDIAGHVTIWGEPDELMEGVGPIESDPGPE